ncbi:uncharacterized protein FIESC28_01845 [Fusarium coffeatum]|uniref:Extracellular membrane protein CFEM domain-containing protein n=1 Tax=Fusarium coffeatum TaxID=231269 RepID=A0A366S916_9HYPO|nr:uncharacterized protein FIESC28_01845 [Fusarium coffeatum]RBR25408.1 hypothetical protein FIESC28_01845 [Fusarium coffeatum]
MSRVFILSLLASRALAANPLLGAYPTDQCDACMDEVYTSCPGNYQERSYATCMCAGDGSVKFLSCLGSCDPQLNEPANAASTYYGYCLMFFKELCDGAEGNVDQETYETQCSKKAIAEGGIGEKGGKSGDGDKTDTGSDDEDAGSDENTEIVKPTRTNESVSDKTGDASEADETDAGSKQTAIPAVAILAGLGLQLVNV